MINAGKDSQYHLKSLGEFDNVTLGNMKNDAYKTAKNGGDYAKFYNRYKDEYLTWLNRAVKSYDAVIAEHDTWIKDPSMKLGNNPDEELVKR